MRWTLGAASTEDVNDADFTISSRIHVTSPNTAVTWFLGNTHTIAWTHDYGAAQAFDIDFSPDAGATWMPVASNVLADSATTGGYPWIVPYITTSQALIRVSPANQPGLGDTSDVTFTLLPAQILR